MSCQSTYREVLLDVLPHRLDVLLGHPTVRVAKFVHLLRFDQLQLPPVLVCESESESETDKGNENKKEGKKTEPRDPCRRRVGMGLASRVKAILCGYDGTGLGWRAGRGSFWVLACDLQQLAK